jgi:hypothetical protein
MKKCSYCGGSNSETEIFCDWCGEKLLPEKRMTLLLFLKYYFQSFAILGIVGAIIFYISSFLINKDNAVFLSQDMIGISLKSILQFGLFICFCFFILLLILLEFELIQVKKQDFSLKFLMLIIIFLLLFVIFLFVLIGLNWLGFIVLSVVALFISIIYIHILDIFVFSIEEETIKTRNLLIITLVSIIVFGLFMLSGGMIISFVESISKIPLPNEQQPKILSQVFNGLSVGFLIGIIVGSLTCGVCMIINGCKITAQEIISFFRK